MTAADMFRGLTELNFSTQPGAELNDSYEGAFPTFGKFGVDRDEFVLLRHSVARRRAIRLLNAPGGLPVWDENDIPAVFRALNPADSSGAAFPTFTYGLSNGQRFMNIVDMVAFSPGGLGTRPTAQPFPALAVRFSDLTNVEASMREAHQIARAEGYITGYPTFRVWTELRTGDKYVDIVAFTHYSTGIFVNSDAPPPSALWTFESLPDLCEGGMALATEAGERVLIDSFDGDLVQRRPTSSMQAETVSIDPDVSGTRRSPDGVSFYPGAQVSAVATPTDLHVIWADRAAFLGTRPLVGPGSFATQDLWTYTTAFGRTEPNPAGWVGYRNSAVASSDGWLHVFAYLSEPPGTSPDTPLDALDPTMNHNLLHRRRYSTTWSAEETVDGDGNTTLGHVDGNVGLYSAGVAERDNTMHVFYLLAGDESTGAGNRLRHAERTAAGWTAETLDGSGASIPPAAPRTGPIRARVGTNVTAAYFDGSIWVVYDDATNGNLRCARGTRVGGKLGWEFHLLDGDGSGTRNTVQSAVLLQWDDVLSVFYLDQSRALIRHAYRKRGVGPWTFDVLDGAGGPDGRVADPLTPYITAAASRSSAQGTPTSPIFVAYLWWPSPTQSTGRVRIATLSGHL